MDGRRATALLGVSIDAGPDEIRRAFRMLALVNHPDRGGDRVEFELIVLAFESLQHVDVTSQLPWRGVSQLPVVPRSRALAPRRRVRLAAPPLATTLFRRHAPRRARPHDAVKPRAVGSGAWRPGSCRHAKRSARRSRRTRTTPTPAASPSSPRCSRPTGPSRFAARRRSTAATRSTAFLEGVGVDLSAASTAAPMIRHHVSNLTIEVASETEATGTCYFLAVTEHGVDHWGRYRDRYVPDATGERWLFAHRSVRTDGTTPGGWAASRPHG